MKYGHHDFSAPGSNAAAFNIPTRFALDSAPKFDQNVSVQRSNAFDLPRRSGFILSSKPDLPGDPIIENAVRDAFVCPEKGREQVSIVKRDRGFSLLELLIVVAIILIIATIAIPSLLRSRQAANESAAVTNMRNLNTAEVTYSSSSGGAYGSIPQLVTAGLIDNRYNSSMAGYVYVIALSVNQLDYTATATAMSTNSGRYDYYTTPDFVIRYSSITTRAPLGLNGEPVR